MDKNKLVEALKKEFSFTEEAKYEKYAENIINTTDIRLRPNVEEWLEGKPLSDIRIGKYSIKLIMGIHEDNEFFSALEAMNNCIRDPEMADSYVWRFRL